MSMGCVIKPRVGEEHIYLNLSQGSSHKFGNYNLNLSHFILKSFHTLKYRLNFRPYSATMAEPGRKRGAIMSAAYRGGQVSPIMPGRSQFGKGKMHEFVI
jgi:hypothetical protein